MRDKNIKLAREAVLSEFQYQLGHRDVQVVSTWRIITSNNFIQTIIDRLAVQYNMHSLRVVQ